MYAPLRLLLGAGEYEGQHASLIAIDHPILEAAKLAIRRHPHKGMLIIVIYVSCIAYATWGVTPRFEGVPGQSKVPQK